MKYFIYLSLFFFTASCSKESSCDQIEYSAEFVAQQGQEFCFSDDNSFQISKVNDNLCPCNTICITEGFISFDVDFTLEGENYQGEISSDPNVEGVLMDPMLPANYKIQIIDQDPPSSEICGTQVKPEDFKFTLKIGKI